MLPKIVDFYTANDIVTRNPGRLNVISVEKDFIIDSSFCNKHLILRIDDISFITDPNIGRDSILPERHHVEEALAFDKLCEGKIHLIHCYAGISRSTAITYAILRGRGIAKDEAMKIVIELAPFASPNKLLVAFADEIFDSPRVAQ